MNVYRKHPHADAYSLDGGTVYTPYAYLATDKRFTDAELAAEVHQAAVEHADAVYGWLPSETCVRIYLRAQSLARFAIYPHFDSEDA